MLVFAAWACLVLACPASSTAPPVEPVRTHSLTVVTTNDGAKAFDSSFGNGNWKALGPYVDLVLRPRSPAVPEGMKTAMYLDVNQCSDRTGPGKNDFAIPDCSGWPPGAFYSQPGYPDRALTTKAGGIKQRFGDPDSTSMRTLTLQAVTTSLHDDGDYDLFYLDDASPPEGFYAEQCWGTPSFAPGAEACAGAPGGKARGPFGGGPENWVRGMRKLVDALPRRVVLNAGIAADAAHVQSPAARLVAEDPHIWGAVCDGCFYGYDAVPKNRYQWSGPLLRGRLDGLIHVTAAGKNVIMVDPAATDPAARERALADVMLFYDADRTWFWYAPCGERSHIRVCPEAALTFYRPVRAYPKDSRDLETPGGALVREFEACYDAGKPVGPCAAVVNPDPDASVALGRLHHLYAHSLRVAGTSLCQCYGDTGSLSLSGPPAPQTLPAASGYVLFR